MRKIVKSSVLLLLVMIVTFDTLAQNKSKNSKKPIFKNQGEQEKYWITKYFEKERSSQKFKVYEGKITAIGDTSIFSNDSLFVRNSSTEIKVIFLKGLLYPTLVGGDKISDIEELNFLENSPQRKSLNFYCIEKDC